MRENASMTAKTYHIKKQNKNIFTHFYTFSHILTHFETFFTYFYTRLYLCKGPVKLRHVAWCPQMRLFAASLLPSARSSSSKRTSRITGAMPRFFFSLRGIYFDRCAGIGLLLILLDSCLSVLRHAGPPAPLPARQAYLWKFSENVFGCAPNTSKQRNRGLQMFSAIRCHAASGFCRNFLNFCFPS